MTSQGESGGGAARGLESVRTAALAPAPSTDAEPVVLAPAYLTEEQQDELRARAKREVRDAIRIVATLVGLERSAYTRLYQSSHLPKALSALNTAIDALEGRSW